MGLYGVIRFVFLLGNNQTVCQENWCEQLPL